MKKVQTFLKFKVFFPILVGIEKLIAGMSSVGNPAVFDNELFKSAVGPFIRFIQDSYRHSYLTGKVYTFVYAFVYIVQKDTIPGKKFQHTVTYGYLT